MRGGGRQGNGGEVVAEKGGRENGELEKRRDNGMTGWG